MNTNINKTFASKAKNSISNGYSSTKMYASNTYNSFSELSSLTKVLIVGGILLIIVLLILWIYNLVKQSEYKSKQSPFLLTKPVNAYNKSGRPIKTVTVPNPVDGLAFSYSFWMYIANWNYRYDQEKEILTKGVGNSVAPSISLYPRTNSLKCQMATYSGLDESCDINNIPLQKWVNVVYVLNNRTIDIYIDGKLERSCVLKNVPKLNNDSVKIANGGGFWGQLAKMQYFTHALIPTEVENIYSEGPYVGSGFTLNDNNNDNKCSDNNDNTDDDDNDNYLNNWMNVKKTLEDKTLDKTNTDKDNMNNFHTEMTSFT